MATRSRKGCIDCKQAKIKCDEVHPACGTCARRSRKCRGYLDKTAKLPRGGGLTGFHTGFDSPASTPRTQVPLLPLTQMPCAPPRRGEHGGGRLAMGGAPTRHGSSSSSSIRQHTLYMPYGRPPSKAMSPTSMGPMGSMASLDDIASIGSLGSIEPMPPSMGVMGSMVPLGPMPPASMASSTSTMAVAPSDVVTSNIGSSNAYDDTSLGTNERTGDIPWAPIGWQDGTAVTPADSQHSHPDYQHHQPASPFPGGTIYTDNMPTVPPMPQTVFCVDDSLNTPSSNDDGLVDDEFLSPGAAAAHATSSLNTLPSSSSPSSSYTSSHPCTHTTPNGRPLVGPDDRRLLGPLAASKLRSPVLEVSGLWFPPTPAPVRGPSFMPLNEILAEDKQFIEMYFLRHPAEMVMSNSFFINEMNGAVLSLLQVSPIVVGESLCAIGENYTKEISLENGDGGNSSNDASGNGANNTTASNPSNMVSHRKTRLLSRLRLLNEDGSSPELVLLLLLALCGAELTNPKSDGKGSSLPALIENVAMVLEFHTRSGHEISTTAKYFAKGVARQDLLHSLSRMQRPKIKPSTWLDDYASRHADRLLGLTATLIPILYKLAELAGDVQEILDASNSNSGNGASANAANTDGRIPPSFYSDGSDHDPSVNDPSLPSMATNNGADLFGDDCTGASAGCFFPDESSTPDASLYLTRRSNLAEREASIRAQLLMWRPIHDHSMSIQTSRTLMLHASAWRTAALLYLYRLFNRPGSSPDADRTALGMAYEVMMHIHGPAEDVKLSLWPLFVAACELDQPEDRALATALFNEVCNARPIMTARRTKEFVMDHIWPARDRGDLWDWMQLTHSGQSNVFMPL